MPADIPRAPAELTPHPPIVKTCGWGVSSAGMRPCARSDQTWRYLAAGHRCHLPQELSQ